MCAQRVIDGFEFAESGGVLRGAVPLSDFPRVRDVLADDRGAVQYEVLGVRDGQGRAALRVKMGGLLRVRCQRCLGILELPLGIDSTLVLAGSLQEMEAEPLEAEGPDRVLADREMKLDELLEDELVLAIPYAPRHERCGTRNERSPERGGHSSPFAGLRDLLDDRTRGKRSKHG